MKNDMVLLSIQVLFAILVSLGTAAAYTEAKFAPKEGTQRDLQRIEGKIDTIYDFLLKKGR